MRGKRVFLPVGAALLGVALTFWIMVDTGLWSLLNDDKRLGQLAQSLGLLGPAAIIVLLAIAVVVIPIPNLPILLAAGATYGLLWGTLYAVAGYLCGGIAAFHIARHFAYERVRRLSWATEFLDELGSQNILTGAIFLLRLIPLVSFDVLSYVAGVTQIGFWRFVIASGFGIAPISLLLVHLGDDVLGPGTSQILVIVVAFGSVAVLPLIGRSLWAWHKSGRGRRG